MKPKTPAEPGKVQRLPLPEPVLSHHSRSLFGPMREWRDQKRIPPVLLLSGQQGIGKRSVAYFLAQWILCERNGIAAPSNFGDDTAVGLFGEAPAAVAEIHGAPLPCGECGGCVKALHGTWIDFIEIEAEEDTFKIDQFRKLKATQGFGAHEGLYRVILIADADRMTTQAANSVLKLLEETPKGWIFLLTAGDPTLLLPTLVSRCQKLRLKPFSKETLETLLEPLDLDDKKRKVCVELAQGSWGRAVSWAQSEAWERRKTVIDFFRDPKSQLNALVDLASQDPKLLEQILDQIENLLSELIQWSVHDTAPESYAWLNADAASVLTAVAKKSARRHERWIAIAERIARARIELQAPINRKLLVQDILLQFLSPSLFLFLFLFLLRT